MSVTRVQEWILIGCGLIAHADEILDIGEWDEMLRLVSEVVSDEQDAAIWRALLADQDAVEERFAKLTPPSAEHFKEILRRCWSMALVDGGDSEVEATVYERVARALGADEVQVTTWREAWDKAALHRAEMTAGLAAAFANLDGELGFSEAIHFDNLLERLPVPIGRRLELATLLHKPPKLEPLANALAELSADERVQVLHQLVPLVNSSERGGREQAALYELAANVGVPRATIEALLGGGAAS